MVPLIETVDLVKEYPQGSTSLRVLSGLNLKVESGEFMAIMGPSGSGKSTLLNMIGALDKPTSGKVYIRGVDLSTLNDNQLAELRNREMGFIFQFFNLIPRIDALGNVELPMAIAGVPRRERRERAAELLRSVGLGERMDHKPSELSGGEQQRVAVARSLVNDPSVLLCDEVTGNLDSKTGYEILQLLRNLNREKGKTFVIITHDPAVAQMTQRLVQLHDGMIIGEKQLW
ncbi:MAG: ABC transporter ATP-binding protein [Candidatus Bathyarchaeota archaeon]|nr:MAG: ABC transporter ATP-binding protein [Candidatus Bathyarchaeota archaeon]